MPKYGGLLTSQKCTHWRYCSFKAIIFIFGHWDFGLQTESQRWVWDAGSRQAFLVFYILLIFRLVSFHTRFLLCFHGFIRQFCSNVEGWNWWSCERVRRPSESRHCRNLLWCGSSVKADSDGQKKRLVLAGRLSGPFVYLCKICGWFRNIIIIRNIYKKLRKLFLLVRLHHG